MWSSQQPLVHRRKAYGYTLALQVLPLGDDKGLKSLFCQQLPCSLSHCCSIWSRVLLRAYHKAFHQAMIWTCLPAPHWGSVP